MDKDVNREVGDFEIPFLVPVTPLAQDDLTPCGTPVVIMISCDEGLASGPASFLVSNSVVWMCESLCPCCHDQGSEVVWVETVVVDLSQSGF